MAGVTAETSKIADLVLIFISFSATVKLYELKGALPENLWPTYVLLFVVYAFFWLVMSTTQSVYQSRRFLSLVRELTLITKTHLLTLAGTLIALNLINPGMFRNRFIYYFAVFCYLFIMLFHALTRWILQIWRKRGKNQRYVLLLGSGEAAKLYLNKVYENPQLGYTIVGYLAPRKNGLNIHYLGSYADTEAVLRNLVVDLVVITAPFSDEGLRPALDILEMMGKNVILFMDEMVSRVARGRPVDFGGLPMVAFDSYPRRPWHQLGKRMLDVIGSSFALILLSPVMLVFAILIKFTSPGPIVFSQNRVGVNGRMFKMYKFRSMVDNAEELKQELAHLNEMSGPVFKIKNDPRVTRVGRLMRKTSLDELPQFWNVLKGEMSLVGPRPPLPAEVNLYDPRHRKRLAVRPGITCIWQISGRNEVDFEEWMDMDAEYVDRWSLWLDMEILAKTVPVVLGRRGAS